MKHFTLPYFGQLDLTALEEDYDVDIEFEGRQIELDLNFLFEKSIESDKLESVKRFIETLPEFNSKCKVFMEKDFKGKNEDGVKSYIEHHLEYIDEEELATIIDFENKDVSHELQMLAKLQLVRVGFYPEASEEFAVFDYSISNELTNYVIAVKLNEKGNLDSIVMES